MKPLPPDSKPKDSTGDCSCAGIGRSVLSGAWRFMLVSIGGFAVWAFGGKWFYKHGGEAGLYAVSAVTFIALAGLLMNPLVRGPAFDKASDSAMATSDGTAGRPWRLARFYGVFMPAFLAYAIVWCGFWFWLRFGIGEWLGSLAGSVVFVAVTGLRLGSFRQFLAVSALFFATHSLGYFAGGKLMYFLPSPEGAKWLSALTKSQIGALAKLSWGVSYGVGFGAGLGFAFHMFQKPGSAANQNGSCEDRSPTEASELGKIG